MLNAVVLACLISLAPPDGYGPLPDTCQQTSLSNCQWLAEDMARRPELEAAWICEGDREKDGRGSMVSSVSLL